jgi:hypothetical protein
MDWIHPARDRDQARTLLKTVLTNQWSIFDELSD